MQSLGETLRSAREARGLTLEEVERATRIRVRYLLALEENDTAAFPSPVHAKGFLRNYAQFLGMDADALTTQYGDLIGAPTAPVTVGTAFHAPPPRPDAIVTQPPRTGGAPGVPLHLARRSPPTGAMTIQEPPFPEAAPPASPVARTLRSGWFTIAVLGAGLIMIAIWITLRLSQVTFDSSAGESNSAFLGTIIAHETVTASPTFQPTSTPVVRVGPDFFNRVALTIRVEQRSWTRIMADGAVVFEGQAEPNTVLQYEAAQSITILAGNGAGLNVSYNGQDIGLLGARGEVVEWLFTLEGDMTPTPTLTITPTGTSVPTPTPTRTPTPRP